jgi:hypothetical protein
MELEITWRRAVRVWWALYWRTAILGAGTFVASTTVLGLLGALLLAILHPASLSDPATSSTFGGIVGLIGLALSQATSILVVKELLGRDLGQFRIVLVSKQQQAQENALLTTDSRPVLAE